MKALLRAAGAVFVVPIVGLVIGSFLSGGAGDSLYTVSLLSVILGAAILGGYIFASRFIGTDREKASRIFPLLTPVGNRRTRSVRPTIDRRKPRVKSRRSPRRSC